LLGTVTAPPYSFSWTPLATDVGNQTLTAVVTDDAGETTSSTAIAVTVQTDNTGGNVDDAIGHWQFEIGSGATLIDSSGNSNDLTYDGAWTTGQVGNSAGQFDGSKHGNLGAPLLQTDQSYSLSAWVKLDSLNGWQTFIGQDADQVSGFWLQYSQPQGGHFFFSIYEQDSLSSGVYRAKSTTQPVVGEWYHLVAVRDKAAGQMRLYVNGVLESQTTEASDWNATGAFVIGRGKWGNPNDYTNGDIDEVRVYDYPVTQAKVYDLFQATPANIAPTVNITTPNIGDTVTVGASTTITASVLSRNDFTLARDDRAL